MHALMSVCNEKAELHKRPFRRNTLKCQVKHIIFKCMFARTQRRYVAKQSHISYIFFSFAHRMQSSCSFRFFSPVFIVNCAIRVHMHSHQQYQFDEAFGRSSSLTHTHSFYFILRLYFAIKLIYGDGACV